MISAATLEMLVDAGLSGDQLVQVVRSIENDMRPAARSKNAERQARHRAKKAAQTDQGVTESVTNNVTRNAESNVTAKKDTPHTPQEKNTPLTGGSARVTREAHPPTELAAKFAEFWAAYPDSPNRGGKKPALGQFRRLVADDGIDPDRLIAAARKYAASRDDAGYCHAAWRWLNDEHWDTGELEHPTTNGRTDAEWRGEVGLWLRERGEDPRIWRRRIGGPEPGEPGCECPEAILAEFDLPAPEPRLKVVGGAS